MKHINADELSDILQFFDSINHNLPYNYNKIIRTKFNKSKNTITELLKRNNKIPQHLRYTCNEEYFDIIDNADKAYWLGFLAADGNVAKTNVITINIHQIDHEHLVKFKNCINATNKIYKRTTISKGKPTFLSTITIQSSNMRSKLIDNGIIPNKTKTLNWNECTKNIPDTYKIDFIRGFFDGDGSWKESVRKNPKRRGRKHSVTFFLGCASREFIEPLKDWFYSNIGLTNNAIQTTTPNFFKFEKSGDTNILKIYSHLYYNDCISLDRKFKKVTDYLLKVGKLKNM